MISVRGHARTTCSAGGFSRTLLVAGTALLLLVFRPALAAPPVQQQLEAARKQYREMEYERVIALVRELPRQPGATLAQKVEALELLGLSRLILGRSAEAREAFGALLQLDPEHLLSDPSGSPKIRQLFEEVKKEMGLAPSPTGSTRASLQHDPPRAGRAARRLLLELSVIRGETQVQGIVLWWRRKGEGSWRRAAMDRRGTAGWGASILLPRSLQAYRIEYYMEAVDAAREVVGRWASARAAHELAVRPARAPGSAGIVHRWWFWVAVGAVVVVGVTAGVLALSVKSAPEGTLPPGVVQLP